MPVYFPLCVSLKYCLNLIIESPLYAKAVQMISALLELHHKNAAVTRPRLIR